MKFVTFSTKTDKDLFGILDGDHVLSVKHLIEQYKKTEEISLTENITLLEMIKEEQEEQIRSIYNHSKDTIPFFRKEDIKFEAPFKEPGKIVCVGNNYMDHCIEQNVEPPKKPMIFSKWASCLIGDNDTITLPDESEQVDYEAELVVVIGKKGKNIAEEQVFDHIFGYSILNDVSARDVQFADVQWVRGKSFDTFAPFGPSIVSKDEIENPHDLDIKLLLNGETLQDSNTKHLIFDIPYIISYLSKSFTFEPGDIIATGTPHGVGVFRDPQVFLKKGDVCTIEIESVGRLKNQIL
ncbi:fumarylacetoacetate hydrolase family protein [Alkalihalobacillus pseudalcaliphilus]|uniref:fumarylacetoacetate hydrolase family protein n=1 Tax=Alkalihalobacillus pseudalcaliphilus TaxID=79884 RepID=UPI00064DCACA|nr:fumarylacetoacetate hydrolase family protein [Alkalihalobacillus pseudalcaliphilus]KMK77993.1 fumarylacetoacetate hydrolase [Alkalihalobacillus pseudalcaliphilus]